MAKFFFTYGTSGQPFVGGWTEVNAPNRKAAVAAFRAFHPDKIGNLVNCSSIYSETEFQHTEMAKSGNFGAFCHETITLKGETNDK